MAENDQNLEENSLESEENLEGDVIDATGDNQKAYNLDNNTSSDHPETKAIQNDSSSKRFKDKLSNLNIYLILFGLIITLTAVIITITYLQSQQPIKNQNSFKTQNLTQNSLNQIAANDASIGTPKQDLNVEANTVFAGKVLISHGLQVAGGVQVNGALNLTSLTVKGTGNFQQLSDSGNLTVSGTTSLQGSTTIASSLQVNGNANFNGQISSPQITTNSLQLNGNLQLTHHLIVSGPSPTSTSLASIGQGGTSTVNGTDTAGSININTGVNPSPGCLININFSTAYSQTPYIIISPVGKDSAGLEYYINKNSSSFEICSNLTPPAQATIEFDYIVIG